MTRRILNAALGLGLGLFTLPLALISWPFFCAWFMWCETDEDNDTIIRRMIDG